MDSQNIKLALPIYQICVDKIIEEDISGRLYWGTESQGILFYGIVEALLTIDSIMEKIDYPQPKLVKKSFGKKEDSLKDTSRDIYSQPPIEIQTFNVPPQRGDVATFILEVKLRENRNWQGTVEWTENKETRNFNSELELIGFIDKISKHGKARHKP